MIAATRSSNTEPDYNSISKLIRKAWKKPLKIIKFYKAVRERPLSSSITVALKACITIQYYFLYGPQDIFLPYKNTDIPDVVFKSMLSEWPKLSKEAQKKEVARAIIDRRAQT